MTQGKNDSKIVYLNVRPNGEAEIVKVFLKPRPRMKLQAFEYDFKELAIKNRSAKGNLLTKNPIKKITLKDEGVSTLDARQIWYDETVKRLNNDNRGFLIGAFEADDKIFYATSDGNCHLINFDLSNHFEYNPIVICKHYPDRVYSVIYYSGEKERYYVKRFQLDNNPFFGTMLDGNPNSKLINIFISDHPRIALIYPENEKGHDYCEIFELDSFIESKGITAKGKRLTEKDFNEILILNSYYPDRNYEDNIEDIDIDENENLDEEDLNIESEYDDFKELERDLNSNNIAIKVVGIVFLLIILVLLVVFINNYFKLGLF